MKTPLIVELVGPAGAGKSTLSKALQQRSPKVCLAVFPDVRAVKNILFFAWNTFLLLPAFLTFYRHKTDRFLSLQEMAYLAILKGWRRILERHSGIIVLDQGPVYMLAELLRFGPQVLTDPAARKWWEATCVQWADCLGIVICLDTSDLILMERIRSRAKKHGVKENSDQWALEFLARYRSAQEKVLSTMEACTKSPKLARFDTSTMSLDETLENILALL
jgi:hypothetical protein